VNVFLRLLPGGDAIVLRSRIFFTHCSELLAMCCPGHSGCVGVDPVFFGLEDLLAILVLCTDALVPVPFNSDSGDFNFASPESLADRELGSLMPALYGILRPERIS
jgi:hypothetical protein